MPPNMSFFYTTEQGRNKTKDVTRRLGWKNLKPGQLFWMVEKAQGLKKGEKIQRIHLCRCVSNTPEVLGHITKAEVVREGFPDMSPLKFVHMFCQHMRCQPSQIVNRIEFKYEEEDQK